MTPEEFEKLTPEEKARLIAFGLIKILPKQEKKFADGGIVYGPTKGLMDNKKGGE